MTYTYPALHMHRDGRKLSEEQRIRRLHWMVLFMLNGNPEKDKPLADHLVKELDEQKHLPFLAS